jgi:glycosyltransferase involved in cell wall biosynthesis
MQGPKPNDVPVAPSIAICIPTCGRPSGLKKLLGCIANLHYGGRISVIVVENELTARAGEAVVKDASSAYPWPLICEVEKVPGQTYAYNRAFVSACRLVERPDYIAVLDDDEYPAESWLQNLVAMALSSEADIVGGPVFPHFDSQSHWLASTKLYEPRRYPQGIVPMIYGAGNMLIRRTVLEDYLDEPFLHEFAYTGGSDYDFFRRCQRDGRTFAWADDAHVYETIPAARLSVKWLLRRAFRVGTDLSRTDRRYPGNRGATLQRLIKGPGLILIGLATLPVEMALGRERMMKRLSMVARGVGRIAAEFHLTFEEYRRDRVIDGGQS